MIYLGKIQYILDGLCRDAIQFREHLPSLGQPQGRPGLGLVSPLLLGLSLTVNNIVFMQTY